MRRTTAAAAAAIAAAAIATVLLLLLPGSAPLHGLVSGSGSASSSSSSPAPATAEPAKSAVAAGPVLPAPSGTAVPTEAGLTSALRAALATPPLQGHTSLAVMDVSSGNVLLRQGSAHAQPASTLKVLTASAALTVLGPEARLTTRVVATPGSDRLVLVGDGDATLASSNAVAATEGSGIARPASLEALARETARGLKASGRRSAQVSYDASLFSGPRTAPSWPATYVTSGVVSPVTALSVDAGRTSPGSGSRSLDPAASAAATFTQELRAQGISVRTPPLPAKAPPGATTLASVSSPPIDLLVERMLTESDNDLAEALAHRTAVGAGLPGTFQGGAAATAQALKGLGLDVTGLLLFDGSGLSHSDEVPPVLLAQVLTAAAGTSVADAALHPVLSGLPVSGWTGTLADRFDGPGARAAAGLVRAKTGTLGTVSTLAGTVVDADGRTLAFALLADNLPVGTTLEARAALDRAAAALARCGCG